MIYIYAIVDRPGVPLSHRIGLEGNALFHCACREIAAVASSFSQAQVQPTRDNLWRHEEVVESLMADCTVLPMRFGTLLADRGALGIALTAHYADFVARLSQVSGKVELSVRVLWDEQPAGDPPSHALADAHTADAHTVGQDAEGSGRSYMMARLEEERLSRQWQEKGNKLAAELHVLLAQHAAASTCRVLISPRMLLTGAYLVERDRMQALDRQVQELRATHPALHFLCTGPWPPYSFAMADAAPVEKASIAESEEADVCP